MSAEIEPGAPLEVALAHAARLLETDPGRAEQQCREILAVVPGHPIALMHLGAARRAHGDATGALAVLEPLALAEPYAALVHYELGLARAAANRGEAAIAALREAVRLRPTLSPAWLALADYLRAAGDEAGADRACDQHIRSSTQDPGLLSAAAALCDNDIPRAESLLRTHLDRQPTDVTALRMLAEVAARLKRFVEAERLLALCLQLAPSFHAARHNYAHVLHRQNRGAAALEQIDWLLERVPGNPGYRNLKAAILAALGEHDAALHIYEQILAGFAHQSRLWMSYGHTLKTAGRSNDGVAAYRRAIELEPSLGEAYWSLANLKTFRFTAAELAAMRMQLQRADLSVEDRYHFEFALGKALEDEALYAESFAHYSEGNRLRRSLLIYDAEESGGRLRRSQQLFSSAFFAARSGYGSQARDPIFIVGLPRSGSTLIEQILASHSAVEGTAELPEIITMAREIGAAAAPALRYPAPLAELAAPQCLALGERYLRDTKVQRKTDRPRFIDKMPNNFPHIGLIQLILPRAKIIDARRHPLGCCVSGFKQHYARGQNFSYSLSELGRYYCDYVELLACYDQALPGRIHRVIYEHMVDDTEAEVRRLLDYCELPFEAACMSFYNNDRAVRTASAAQVRQPIYRQGVDQWRHFEPWLGPLKEALGTVLTAYPDVPAF